MDFSQLCRVIEGDPPPTPGPFTKYCEHGFYLVPIPEGRKGPTRTGWNKRERCIGGPKKAAALTGNAGLAHVYSGTCAVDVDDYLKANTWLADRGIDLPALLTAPDAVQINSGRENRAKLLYRLPPGVKPPVLQLPPGSGLELRCAASNGLTMQDLLPPSIHPDTKAPYTWGGAGDWRNLPDLPADLLALWRTLERPGTDQPVGRVFFNTGDIRQPADGSPVEKGGRNHAAASLAGGYFRDGLSLEETEAKILEWNADNPNPLGDKEIKQAVRSIRKTHEANNPAQPIPVKPFDPVTYEWPEPKELPNQKLPVLPFDYELLPGALRSYVQDIADRMQCPPDFPAVAIMLAAGAVIGRQCAIRPKRQDDWTVVPNLWGGCIGRPAVMKSPALKQALTPVQRLIYQAREAHTEATKENAQNANVAKAQLIEKQKAMQKAARSGGEREIQRLAAQVVDLQEAVDAQVTERRYIVNDPTVEKLGELLCENPNGLLVFRDELTGWLHNLDREDRSNDRSFYLEAWAGDGGYVYDRIGRGTVVIDAACVSVLGGVQPGPLAQYVAAATSNHAGADGLLQRFQLLVWPDDPGKWVNVDRWPDSEAKSEAFEVFRWLANVELPDGGPESKGDIPFLRLEQSAQEVFNKWLHELMNTKVHNLDSEALESHLSKFRSLVPSLALIVHLADGGIGPVSREALTRAIGWAEYLESHARRIYAHGVGGGLAEARALAARIKAKDLPEEFTVRTLSRKQWRWLTRREDVDRAIETLEDFGWLKVERRGTGGRPADVCIVNPGVAT